MRRGSVKRRIRYNECNRLMCLVWPQVFIPIITRRSTYRCSPNVVCRNNANNSHAGPLNSDSSAFKWYRKPFTSAPSIFILRSKFDRVSSPRYCYLHLPAMRDRYNSPAPYSHSTRKDSGYHVITITSVGRRRETTGTRTLRVLCCALPFYTKHRTPYTGSTDR